MGLSHEAADHFFLRGRMFSMVVTHLKNFKVRGKQLVAERHMHHCARC